MVLRCAEPLFLDVPRCQATPRSPLVLQERGISGKGTLAGNSGWCFAAFAATFIRNVFPGFWRACVYTCICELGFLVFCFFFFLLFFSCFTT